MSWFDIVVTIIPAVAFILVCLPALARTVGLNLGEIVFALSALVPALVFFIHAYRMRRLIEFEEYLSDHVVKFNSERGWSLRPQPGSPDCPDSLRPSQLEIDGSHKRWSAHLEYWADITADLVAEATSKEWMMSGADEWAQPVAAKFKDDCPLTADEWHKIQFMAYWLTNHSAARKEWVRWLQVSSVLLALGLYGGLAISVFGSGAPSARLLAGVLYLSVPWCWLGLIEAVQNIGNRKFGEEKVLAAVAVGFSGIINCAMGAWAFIF